MANEPNQQRREFFREGLAKLIGPAGDFLERRFNLGASRTVLRPPGALREVDFLETCHRCGACVEVCPASAIFPWSSGDPETEETPIIDPDQAACVVCDGLDCMHVCPSGALRLVGSAADIRMGMAHVSRDLCVRSRGEDCTICIDRCPLGQAAIRMGDDAMPQVLDPGCVGCGVCQLFCPTRPRAITITPS
jgi:MauM/NapG family ferredoxin protein